MILTQECCFSGQMGTMGRSLSDESDKEQLNLSAQPELTS